jgi:hypothetical protein
MLLVPVTSLVALPPWSAELVATLVELGLPLPLCTLLVDAPPWSALARAVLPLPDPLPVIWALAVPPLLVLAVHPPPLVAALVAVQGDCGAAEALGASSDGPRRAKAPTAAAVTARRPSHRARRRLWVLA